MIRFPFSPGPLLRVRSFGRTCAALAALVPFGGADSAASAQGTANHGSFFARYQARVTATQNEQPHWLTPLVTNTPRLGQEYRAEFVRTVSPAGYSKWNLGNSRGLELVPARRFELRFNPPPYFFHSAPRERDGFGDVSFNAKFRIVARNEQHGNFIVTALLGATIPTGKSSNGSCCAVVTPTLGVGKGLGQFVFTSTAGGSLPVTNAAGLGHAILWNDATQYRLAKTGTARYVWPELEFNSTFYKGGPNDGKTAVYATPGVVIGRIPLTHDAAGKPGRLSLTFGAGEQIALSKYRPSNHNLVISMRMPF